MRRIHSSWCVLALAVGLVAMTSCNKKTEVASETTSDSLLASNPVEQPAGNLTPQTQYEQPSQPTNEPEPPAPTSAPTHSKPKTTKHTPTSTPTHSDEPQGVTIAEGTPMTITVSGPISTESAKPGDSWTGTVKDPVIVGSTVAIPAGSTVHGVVTGSLAAEKGNRATLVLAVEGVTVDGHDLQVSAETDSIIAGSPRARNIGAVAGGVAAGALIGKAVGGGKGALIGGLLGGATAGGAVAKSKGYQVVVKDGTVLTFNVAKSAHIRS
jgi:hypothetical protein